MCERARKKGERQPIHSLVRTNSLHYCVYHKDKNMNSEQGEEEGKCQQRVEDSFILGVQNEEKSIFSTVYICCCSKYVYQKKNFSFFGTFLGS